MKAMSSKNSASVGKWNLWEKHRSKIVSGIGVWRGGIDVYCRGYSLFSELMGKVSYMQLHILNCTGKLLTRAEADWLECNWMGLSYPDSRIWCNQVAALCGDMGTTPVDAVAAAILTADSRAFGGSQTSKIGMEFLQKAMMVYKAEKSMDDVILLAPQRLNKPMINGFARPVDRQDERLGPYKREMARLGLEQGEYLLFALALSDYLYEKYQLGINSGGFANAFLLDCGITPEEAYLIKSYAVASGAVACYADNLHHSQPRMFLPLRCQDIQYTGIAPRPVPD
mgnify:CR=1 FL=1